MASSKLMPSSKPRNSDLSSRAFTKTTTTNYSLLPTMVAADGVLRDAYATPATSSSPGNPSPGLDASQKTVDEVWREIMSSRKEMKEEDRHDGNDQNDEMMTLEDFLARAEAVEGVVENDGENEGKVMVMSGGYGAGGFDHQQSVNSFRVLEGGIVGYGNGVEGGSGGGGGGGRRGKRGRGAIGVAAVGVLEPLDKAAAQRQRRMIKNRESAARSRERKQAYQVELESLAIRLEEENERLLKEKEKRAKERLKQIMENVIPVVEKRRPPRKLQRVNSL